MPSNTHAAPSEGEHTAAPHLDDEMNALRPIELPPLPENPLVSVLVANYNYARFIGQAIQSVLDQTYSNFEVVICDDGSTDNSVEVIEGFARRDSRVRLVRQQNGGMASAWNTAYWETQGRVICLLDADDYCMPHRLAAVTGAFRRSPHSGLLFHRLFRVDASGRQRGIYPLLWELPTGWLAREMLAAGGELPIGPPTSGVCLRRPVCELIFPMPEEFRRSADGLVGALAPLMTCIASVDAPLASWREHGSNLTTTSAVTAEDMDRELVIRQRLWAAQKDYLERSSPGAVSLLAPVENRPMVLAMKYVSARIRGDHDAPSVLARLIGSRGFAALPSIDRLFWKASALLPRPLFQRAVGLLWGQSKLKKWTAWAVSRRRQARLPVEPAEEEAGNS